MGSIGESVSGMCADVIGWVFRTFLGVGEKISNVSSLSGEEGSLVGTIWDSLNSGVVGAIESLQPVGMALCMLFFIISLLELAMSERMTMEYFVKYLSKLVIGVAAVYYAPLIWETLTDFGDSMSKFVGGFSFGIDSDDPSETVNQMVASLTTSFTAITSEKGAAIWIALLVLTIALFPIMGLVGVAMTIVAYIVSFSRVLELCVRGVFLPIATSLLSDDGWRGAGGRYIRKLLALCCQGAVLAIIGKVTTGMICLAGSKMLIDGFATVEYSGLLDCFGTVLGGFALIIGVGFACISLMFKSIGIVNDVFGG